MNNVVILGSKQDLHVSTVLNLLEERNMSAFVLDSDNVESIEVYFDEVPKIMVDGQELAQPNCIWSRVKHLRKKEYPLEDLRDLKFSENQWQEFYNSIAILFEEQSVQSFRNIWLASKKLRQLYIASSLGFVIPKTSIISTQRQAQAAFHTGRKFIVKCLGVPNTLEAVWDNGEYKKVTYSAPLTYMLEEEDFEGDEDSYSVPFLLQSYVEKKYEYRFVYVGGKIFSYKIDSQSKEYTRVDWRIGSYALNFELCKIPYKLECLIHKYMQTMGLRCGSFDFIEQPDGEFVFLECNPEGQWQWLEHNREPIISQAHAELIESICMRSICNRVTRRGA